MLKERLKLIDKWIAIPFIILILFSVIAVYSASSYSAMEEYGTLIIISYGNQLSLSLV